MDDIRNALLTGEGNKLSKKQYKFAVELEKSRLLQQLIFLTFVSFLIALILFVSLYFDIHNEYKMESTTLTEWGTVFEMKTSASSIHIKLVSSSKRHIKTKQFKTFYKFQQMP